MNSPSNERKIISVGPVGEKALGPFSLQLVYAVDCLLGGEYL